MEALDLGAKKESVALEELAFGAISVCLREPFGDPFSLAPQSCSSISSMIIFSDRDSVVGTDFDVGVVTADNVALLFESIFFPVLLLFDRT